VEKLFYPESIGIIGLSSKQNNIPRLVLENLIRWGYKGRIFGINPRTTDSHVDGIKMYTDVVKLPVVPDLVYILIPAKLIPDVIEACGKFGSNGWLYLPVDLMNWVRKVKNFPNWSYKKARKYGIRFVGPKRCYSGQHSQWTLSAVCAFLQSAQRRAFDNFAKRRRRPYALEFDN